MGVPVEVALACCMTAAILVAVRDHAGADRNSSTSDTNPAQTPDYAPLIGQGPYGQHEHQHATLRGPTGAQECLTAQRGVARI